MPNAVPASEGEASADADAPADGDGETAADGTADGVVDGETSITDGGADGVGVEWTGPGAKATIAATARTAVTTPASSPRTTARRGGMKRRVPVPRARGGVAGDGLG
jgi:hypothetical protein